MFKADGRQIWVLGKNLTKHWVNDKTPGHLVLNITGFPRSGKSQGKMIFFQGQGKVREF